MGWPNNYVQGVYDSTGKAVGFEDGAGGYVDPRQPDSPNVVLLGDSLTAQNLYQFAPTSASSNGATVTITFASHGVPNLNKIRVVGMGEYNTDDAVATYLTANTFTYPSTGAANGSISINATYARVMCKSLPSNNSYYHLANGLLGGGLKLVANLANSSETSTQIAARISDVLNYDVKECWVLAGTNDDANGITALTTKANLKSIYDFLRGRGIFVRAITIPPLGSSHANFATATPKFQQINEWIKQYAKTVTGIAVADAYGYVVNSASATGAQKTASLQSDHTHLTSYGALLVAQAIQQSYQGKTYNTGVLTTCQVDGYASDAANPNIFPSAPWTNTGGTAVTGNITGTTAASFSVTSTGTGIGVASCPARSDGYGYDQQVVFTPASASDTVTIALASTGTLISRVTAGDKYTLRCNLSLTGVSGSNLSYYRSLIQLIVDGVSYQIGSQFRLVASGASNIGAGDLTNLTFVSEPMIIPTGTISAFTVNWSLGFLGAGTAVTYKVGRISMVREDVFF